jgi:hypothetical protein
MTFLELCQRARQECGASGSGPSTVSGQQGQLKKIVDWVAQAWLEIQGMRPDWRFMVKEFSFTTTAATRDYSADDLSITDLDQWDTDSFLIYKTATGASDQGALPFLPYLTWRDGYRARMTDRADDRPILFTLKPDGELRFEPRPDASYTIEGDYQRTLQTFTDNTDEPTGLPSKFHMMIVFKAMQYYGFHESAPDVLANGEALFEQWLPKLEREQLPPMTIGARPIA